MHFYHVILAILVAAVWGVNFIFISLGLQDIPPLMLCALRFLLTSIPVFFIKKPAIPYHLLALYGIITFALQFIFLFIGMQAGMPPGLTSLVVQVQIVFSLILAAIFLDEKPNKWQMIGALVAFSGIGVVWVNLSGQPSLAGFILVLASAASWGVSNLITKKIGNVSGIGLVVWGSLIAFPFLLLFSLIFEGTNNIMDSLQHFSRQAELSLFFIVCISTWFAYGAWNWLLGHYSITAIVPFTLLVPVFGMLSATVIFDEPMETWKMTAALLVIIGLFINLFAPRIVVRIQKKAIEDIV